MSSLRTPFMPLPPDRPVPSSDIGPSDAERMSAAAAELRERTMSFERVAAPTPWLFSLGTIALVATLVWLLLAYRRPLAALLRGIGL